MKGSDFCSYVGGKDGGVSNHNVDNTGDQSYLEVLVGSLLPLLVHGVWCRLGKHTTRAKQDQADEHADSDTKGDLLALIGRRKGTGTVRTESNPVGCWVEALFGSVFYFRFQMGCILS